MKNFALLTLASVVAASPCPYGALAERGVLPKEEADKFFAARDAKNFEDIKLAKRDAEHAAQEHFYKRQLDLGDLLNGGGLLGGILQPFTGVLAGLAVPTPQQFSLNQIPGDDAAQ